MAKPVPEELSNKFTDMTKNFREKADNLMREINGTFNGNMGNGVKNYVDLQTSYLQGFQGIANGAKQANGQLLQSFDNNYTQLKKQIGESYQQTQKKSNEAIETSTKDFKTQCEDALKKVPGLPEKDYQEVMKHIQDSKGKLNTDMEKQYKDLIDKLEKNYQLTRKELTMMEIKEPKLPTLDIAPGIMEASKATIQKVATKVGDKYEQLLPQVQSTASRMSQNISKHIAETSKSFKSKH